MQFAVIFDLSDVFGGSLLRQSGSYLHHVTASNVIYCATMA